ncbi:MAG: hypothetical protein Q3M24_00180 [Candidatus Electrothrix aestuarii]|uniref:Restriction endonuclease subunit R n=1 Tax=Candidatus Electrothrix aestuarii TaxID=3062594 RepID=A0AAU8LVI4_9BACT|nr:hypothetical protein [Candidatus Electrothrix aestuarii]
MRSFREWSLADLDRTFALTVLDTSPVLEDWLNGQEQISSFEQEALRSFQTLLKAHVYDWNETELAYNFIGPLMTLVRFSSKEFNFFAERPLNGVVDGIEMSGEPDGIIASGFREPQQPYFCLQEYKKEKDPEGDPAAQVLAAMLVAQELNQHKLPVYGCYVKGEVWHFLTLQERSYAISQGYLASRQADLDDIFRILKNLKVIITASVTVSAVSAVSGAKI